MMRRFAIVALLLLAVSAKFEGSSGDWDDEQPAGAVEYEKKGYSNPAGNVDDWPAEKTARGGSYAGSHGDFDSAYEGRNGDVSYGDTEYHYEDTHKNTKTYNQKLADSFSGVWIGFVLFILSFPILFWNEGNYVWTKNAISNAGKLAVTVPSSDAPSPSNNGKPVFVQGELKGSGTLTDTDFEVSRENALILKRETSMYQWQENKSVDERRVDMGNGRTRVEKTPKYTYRQVWSEQHIDSSIFEGPEKQNYQNPPTFSPVPRSFTWTAESMQIGMYNLGLYFKNQIKPSKEINKQFRQYKGAEKNNGDRKTGDVRVTHYAADARPVSILGRQESGGGLGLWTDQANNRSISAMASGTVSLSEVLKGKASGNSTINYIGRAVGFFLMWAALNMMWAPLVQAVDFVPLLGPLVGFATDVGTFIAAFVFSLLTVMIAWLWYRPIIAITIITACIAAIYNKQLLEMMS